MRLVVAPGGQVHQSPAELGLHLVDDDGVELQRRRVLNLVKGILDDVHRPAIVLAKHHLVDGVHPMVDNEIVHTGQGVLRAESHSVKDKALHETGVESRG